MDDQFEKYKKIFDCLLEADRNIWQAVVEIGDGGNGQLDKFVQPLMNIRGDLHVEFMRPIYKKYPKIAEMAGFNETD